MVFYFQVYTLQNIHRRAISMCTAWAVAPVVRHTKIDLVILVIGMDIIHLLILFYNFHWTT